MEAGVMLSLSLPCDERAPGSVREAVQQLSEDRAAFGDVMLVASELVTNAVRHSGAGSDDRLEVAILRQDDHVLVSVTDPGLSGATAQALDPAVATFRGLGLMVVQQLASQWGEERAEGYRVWARVPVE
jgi:anti-sigma regulatory factor (Ser/Thr protein kinase)